jgi:lipopolysaccharide transport system ATP-binding protein
MASVIRVENVSKRYRLGSINRQMLYQDLQSRWARWRGHEDPHSKIGEKTGATGEIFWALDDINFDVREGEVIGLIGGNGAGKSTLLKILSNITAPTKGRICLKGTVASLLEVGTGFHPELTGRENIYLNGAILGMRHAEISRKFDQIVDFAEVEQFIDTPVKRYSSGMYVRLAFAVAAHLSPGILIIDEVLAVGDARFQEKCLGKMSSIAGEGRTILFVSHNMGAIRALCSRGILLREGRMIMDGSIDEAITRYAGDNFSFTASYEAKQHPSSPHFETIVASQEPQTTGVFSIERPLVLTFAINPCSKRDLTVGLVIRNSQGVWVQHSSDEFAAAKDPGSTMRRCVIPPHALAPGKYHMDALLAKRNEEAFETIVNALSFEIEFDGTMSARTKASDWKGACGPGLVLWE